MPRPIKPVRDFLESLERFDLSRLLDGSVYEIKEVPIGDGAWGDDITEEAIVIYAPEPCDEAIKALPQFDRQRIAEAVARVDWVTRKHTDVSVQRQFEVSATGNSALLAELIAQQALMVSVATGGPRIAEVDDYYKARERRIRSAVPEGVSYANPFKSLWEWHGHWSTNFDHYRERRMFIRDMFAPAIEAVSKAAQPVPHRDPTGWELVDSSLAKARTAFETASAEDDLQAVGLRCREVIISVAQAVYDPGVHGTLDGIEASATDAKRMMDAYIAHTLPGESNKELRAHVRASFDLANKLQHRRTADRKFAALCLEAATSAVAVISILSRDGS
jgi:hypothetical protein